MVPLSRTPHARYCAIPCLQKNKRYLFKIRAINKNGTGQLSKIAELPTGAIPFARPPQLVTASYENSTLTYRWPHAVERGAVVYSYLLKLESVMPLRAEAV